MPENEKILSEIKLEKMPKLISLYGTPTGITNNLRRPTEEAAINIATDTYILQLKLSVNAVRSVYDKLSPEDKELIRLMYWSNNIFNADAISIKLNMARTTVYDRLNHILIAVGRRLGYVNMF